MTEQEDDGLGEKESEKAQGREQRTKPIHRKKGIRKKK